MIFLIIKDYMLSSIKDKITGALSQVIGDEVGRQNAIARFGSGIRADANGNVPNPSRPGEVMSMKNYLLSDNVNDTQKPRQISPETLTGRGMFDLLKNSITSDDKKGLSMRIKP